MIYHLLLKSKWNQTTHRTLNLLYFGLEKFILNTVFCPYILFCVAIVFYVSNCLFHGSVPTTVTLPGIGICLKVLSYLQTSREEKMKF